MDWDSHFMKRLASAHEVPQEELVDLAFALDSEEPLLGVVLGRLADMDRLAAGGVGDVGDVTVHFEEVSGASFLAVRYALVGSQLHVFGVRGTGVVECNRN